MEQNVLFLSFISLVGRLETLLSQRVAKPTQTESYFESKTHAPSCSESLTKKVQNELLEISVVE